MPVYVLNMRICNLHHFIDCSLIAIAKDWKHQRPINKGLPASVMIMAKCPAMTVHHSKAQRHGGSSSRTPKATNTILLFL